MKTYTPKNIEIFELSASDFLNAETGSWQHTALAGVLHISPPSDKEREEAANDLAGFYWWSCCPGCLPDGDPSGPFDTFDEANADAGGGEYEEKVLALALHLECDPADITEESYSHYGLTIYSAEGGEYAVGTDEEANEACQEAVKDSIWAFNASFILSECELPRELDEAIEAFQGKKCERANDALLALVEKCCGLEEFTQSAVSADGRGHFLSQYDSNENEQEVDGETFYIYRIN